MNEGTRPLGYALWIKRGAPSRSGSRKEWLAKLRDSVGGCGDLAGAADRLVFSRDWADVRRYGHGMFSSGVEGLTEERAGDPDETRPWLTFVVGPGCLQISSNDGLAGTTIRNAIEQELTGLVSEAASASEDEPIKGITSAVGALAVSFVEQMIDWGVGKDDGRWRRSDLPAADQPSATERDQEGPPSREQEQLDRFRALLAVSAACATRLLYRGLQADAGEKAHPKGELSPVPLRWGGAPLSATVNCLPDAGRGELAAGEMDDALDADEEIEGLMAALSLLQDVDSAEPGLDRPLLNAGSLVDGLRALHDKVNRTYNDRKRPRVTLSTDDVGWLNDMLWHTLIFDAPLEPTTSELNVRIQFSLNDRPERRTTKPIGSDLLANETLELAYAQHLGTADRAVARKARQAASPPDPRSEFFDRIARCLVAHHGRWKGNPRRVPAPIILSTTFDLELERALWHQDHPFFVAMPVLAYSRRRLTDNTWSEGWLRFVVARFGDSTAKDLGADPCTVERPSAWHWLPGRLGSSVYPERFIDSPGLRPSVDIIEEDNLVLDGPLVIKLNGSPLHEVAASQIERLLPQAGGEGEVGQIDGICHALSFNDYTHLAFTVAELAPDRPLLPGWVTMELAKDRRFWVFFGLRYAEWSVKQQLYVQIAKVKQRMNETRDEQARQFDRFGIAVNRKIEPWEEDLLTWLGVDVIQADCADFTGDLDLYAEDLELGRRRSFDGKTVVFPEVAR